MGMGTGKSFLLAALATSPSQKNERYSHFHFGPFGTSSFGPGSRSAMSISRSASPLLRDMARSGEDSEGEAELGCDYIHSDIAAMLQTKASHALTNQFAINPDTLTLVRARERVDSGNYSSRVRVMPLERLASLADECDRVISSGLTGTAPRKITGLICLSRNLAPSSSPDERIKGENPGALVASMVALNLLESSIRAVVMRSRGREGVHADDNSKRTKIDPVSRSRGAPLLKDMIEELSGIDDLSCDLTSSTSLCDESIWASDLAPILRALLTPTRMGGINLRNLACHGFLSGMDSRWLSLTLVLIVTLDSLLINDAQQVENDGTDIYRAMAKGKYCAALAEDVSREHGTSSLTKHYHMENEVRRGRVILLNEKSISCPSLDELATQACDFVPVSHAPLLRFSLQVLAPTLRESIHATSQKDLSTRDGAATVLPIPSLAAIFTTALCSLLEHSLRLLWCRVNNRPNNRIARPSEYYVTLDGHGQRDRHEVMITPYLSDGRTKNLLVSAIGSESCALLSDLFAAPLPDAPNIRSAVCHGTWDGELVRELEGLSSFSVGKSMNRLGRSDPLLTDTACALLSCFHLIVHNVKGIGAGISTYRPVYSYTASAVGSLSEIFHNLAKLDDLISNNSSIDNCTKMMGQQQPKICSDLRHFKVELNAVKEIAFGLFPALKKSESQRWGIEDTYSEYKSNIRLAENIAALALLSDVRLALKRYLKGLLVGIDKLSLQPKGTKDRRVIKTAARYCSAVILVRDFYILAVYVALLAVGHCPQSDPADDEKDTGYYVISAGNLSREDIVRAAERSRMALSTFDSYLTTNLDRSLKALQQYLLGKVVKKVFVEKIS